MCVCWRWSVFWQPVCSAWSSKGPRTPPGIKARWDVRLQLQLSIKSHEFKLQIANYCFKISGGACIALFYSEHSLWFLTQALFTQTLTLILMNTSGESQNSLYLSWRLDNLGSNIPLHFSRQPPDPQYTLYACVSAGLAGRCCSFSTVSKKVEKKLFLYQL